MQYEEIPDYSPNSNKKCDENFYEKRCLVLSREIKDEVKMNDTQFPLLTIDKLKISRGRITS